MALARVERESRPQLPYQCDPSLWSWQGRLARGRTTTSSLLRHTAAPGPSTRGALDSNFSSPPRALHSCSRLAGPASKPGATKAAIPISSPRAGGRGPWRKRAKTCRTRCRTSGPSGRPKHSTGRQKAQKEEAKRGERGGTTLPKISASRRWYDEALGRGRQASLHVLLRKHWPPEGEASKRNRR